MGFNSGFKGLNLKYYCKKCAFCWFLLCWGFIIKIIYYVNFDTRACFTYVIFGFDIEGSLLSL